MDRTPARKITNHGREIVTGGFASKKTGAIIPWESQIERDFLFHLEFDHSVLSYRSQAIKIEFNFQGKVTSHFPDIQVVRPNNQIDYYEVKPAHVTESSEFQEKTKIITEHLARQGHGYSVVTDKDIRVEPKFGNLKLLYRYLNVEISPDDEKTILDLLNKQMPIHAFSDLLDDHDFDLADCYALMAREKIDFDINDIIHPFMLIARSD